jgi:hypothetical protein
VLVSRQRKARHRRPRRTVAPSVLLLALALPLGLLGSGAMVWRSSYAAFSGTTANGTNSWSAGTVSLSDSQGGSSSGGVGTALWSVTGLLPGDTGTKCIKVTYGGSLNLSASGGVRLYVASGGLTGSLGTYLRLSIDEGTAGASSDCSDFGGTITNLYNSGNTDNAKTLATFASSHSTWATGVSTWAPTASGQSRSYRITWTVLDDNAAQGTSASATLSWQADS